MKAHKYKAKPTVVDGIRFASTKEARRYGELKLLERAGEIQDLQVQPAFALTAGGAGYAVGVYRADFSYVETRTQNTVVEDVKGFRTDLYKWKAKHLRAEYGIVIKEV